MKRLLLFSILSVSLVAPKAHGIVIGGCLFPFASFKAIMAATVVAAGAFEGGKAVIVKLLEANKAKEANA